MSPLRRPIALLGLLALLMTAWMVATQQLSLADAGLRAVLVLVLVRVLDKGSTWGLRKAAGAAAKVSTRGRIVTAPADGEKA